MEWKMQLFCKGIIFTCFIALCACSEQSTDVVAEESQAPALTGADDETRTITIQSATQCQLVIKQGKKSSDAISPKSCKITRSADGFVTQVTVLFDPPCKQYNFNNVIGDRYFLDEKSIVSKNKACRIETFNATYGWELKEP
jgi:hypothetical protein